MRLVEAAEKLFLRKGFEDASVDEISETAGYSRGAFYSNFKDKEQVFLAVMDRRRPKALDEIFQQVSGSAERIAAIREWFTNQWRLKDFIALRMEFTRRAMRDRSVLKHLAELRSRELETYASSVGRYLIGTGATGLTNRVQADRPELVALVLLAVVHGLGSLAIDSGTERESIFTEAAKLAFDRMTGLEISHQG